MCRKRRMPVGVEDFKKLVEQCYFVDKTRFIQELLDTHGDVTLITRPRRFGKTLTLSMLQYFFTQEKAETNRALFHGLAIERAGEHYMAEQGTRPVIFFTLKDIKMRDWASCIGKLRYTLAMLFEQFHDLEQSDRLSQGQRKRFSDFLHDRVEAEIWENSLQVLCQCLERHFGQKVLLLIDEYDAPIQCAWEHGYYAEAISFFRNFFGAALKTNSALDFAVITGVLRISKESIFSALNNLKISSVLKGNYPDVMGFTQDETRTMASDLGYEDKLPELREWYDGYNFSGVEIYNPWSVINYFADGCHPQPYWANTSGNAILAEMLEHVSAEQEKELYTLLTMGTIAAPIRENVIYADIHEDRNALYMMLLTTGYLKAVPSDMDGTDYCTLQIPNQEVRKVYADEIFSRLTRTAAGGNPARFFEYLVTGNVEDFEKELSYLLETIVSFHDTAKNPEAFYHGFLNGMLAILSPKTYEIQSNKESGYGRFDIALFPKRADRAGVLMEFKAAGSLKTLNAKAKAALAQMECRDYTAEFRKRGIHEVWTYGIAFRGKKVRIIGKNMGESQPKNSPIKP